MKKKLTKKAKDETIFIDVYYDTVGYNLTKNDIWLRNRNDQFELRLPMQKSGQYSEIEGEEKIRQIFGIVPDGNFLEDISEFGYQPFCEIKNPKKIGKEKFSVEKEKIIEYLKQKRPDHYQALIERGIAGK